MVFERVRACVRLLTISTVEPPPSPGRPPLHPSDHRLSLTAPRVPARDQDLKGQQLAITRRRWREEEEEV